MEKRQAKKMRFDEDGTLYIEEEHRRAVLGPNDPLAAEVLTPEELAEARKVWTPELETAWRAKRPVFEEVERDSLEQRLAKAEAKVADLEARLARLEAARTETRLR